jgi:3-dehydroquinate dehydratase / shikimate dehydrogenase
MTEPQLCVAVSAPTMEDLRRARDAAEGADLVELRLDSVDRPDAAGALEGRRRPVIVTCRPRWEGGGFDGSEEERRRVLESALRLGAEFVDLEAAASFTPALIQARAGRGIIVSRHWFDPPVTDLASTYAALRWMGAEVTKLAIPATRLADTLALFELAAAQRDDPSGHVLIGMGAPGIPSRVLAAKLRNLWTYAGDGVAPGQLPLARMLRDFRFRRIAADSTLFGVVGNPIAHSRSPAMHNAGFAAVGLNAAYVPLEASDADDFVRFARELDLRGASITAPFKVALMPHVDEIDPLARRVGAINTIVVRGGRWIGANTDVEGFLAPLMGRIALRGVRASVLGSGGAARAVAVALAEQGAAITICARRSDAAAQIATMVGGTVGAFPPRAGSWDVLVNATPAGSTAAPENPIAGASLDGEILFDLVYDPAETRLLADARSAGCLTIGGLEMLIAQAERQFELWTGQRPPAGLFQAAAATEEESRAKV